MGTLTAVDPDSGATFTWSLVSGTGDTDNASFAVSGASLNTAAVFNFEVKNSYSVRLRATDAGGLSHEESLTITVTNVNESSDVVSLDDNNIGESLAAGTSSATLSSTDVDAGDTFTYSLVSGAGSTDNASFAVSGANLVSAAVFNFNTKSSYSVRIRATDAGGSARNKPSPSMSPTATTRRPTSL